MKKYAAPLIAAAILLSAGSASAQTVTSGGVTYTSTPVTTSIGAGTGTNLGTVTVASANASSTQVASIPLTFTPGNGGALGNLSGCLVYSNGTANSTPFTPQQGVNTVTLLTSVTVGVTGGTATFTIRCDVGSSVAGGSTFTVVAGPAGSAGTTSTATTTTGTTGATSTPTTGTGTTTGTGSASGSTTAGLTVNLDVAPSVPAGSADVALANIWLGGAGLASAGRISSIPVTITAGNGGSVANLTGCYVRSAITDGSAGMALSNITAVQNNGQSTFSLIAPYGLVTGQETMLSLVCSVQPATPIGSTFTISITPSAFAPTDLSGNAIPVAAATTPGLSGLAPATSGTVIVSGVVSGGDTGGTSGTGTDTGAVGVPNTGAGGMAGAYLLVLLVAGVIALTGGMYVGYRVLE